jgi:ATP synthase protein I
VLKVVLPRPSSDAVIRGDGRSPFRADFCTNVSDDEEAPIRRWSRSEAEDLARRQPALSPWWVVLSQLVTGALAATVMGLASGSVLVAQSALYGAAVVALPGALMARGATSRLGLISPLTSAVSMMVWAMVKLTASVAMLALAPRVVPGLSWPAMLTAVVLCMQTYGFALLWRGRAK